MKYCPVICGRFCTSVVATGQVGVWRCTQLDFSTSNDSVLEEMASEEQLFQPELHDFFVVEVSNGMFRFLE